MSNIIAARFAQQEAAEAARAEILRAGFPEDQVSSFYVSPPGQHDMTPLGGDEIESPGTHSRQGVAEGALTGGVIGAAAGLAGTAVLGPVAPLLGALVGAHVGNLTGPLSETEDSDTIAAPPFRREGMMLAVAAGSAEEEQRIIDVLRALDAQDIERAEGTMADGDWQDFNPLQAPHLIDWREAPSRPDVQTSSGV